MSKIEGLEGKVFGRLTVIKECGRDKSNNVLWMCKCECGNEVVTRGTRLIHGDCKSCGCYKKYRDKTRNTTHGLTNTRLFRIWDVMKSRCYNPNAKSYDCYGKRGIKICDEWLNKFIDFYNWAMNNGYKDNLTIDRIDVNGNYEPSNCRWLTVKEQGNNKRDNRMITYNGKTQTFTQWCDELNISKNTMKSRIDQCGWSIEKAFTTPIRRRITHGTC